MHAAIGRCNTTVPASGAVKADGNQKTMLYFIRKLLMRNSMQSMLLAVGLVGSAVCFAQAPAAAPANATGLCNDGSYTTSATKKGACSKHQGVKDWYGAASTSGAAAPAASTEAAPKAAPKAASPSPAPAAPAPAAPAAKAASEPMAAAAPGGGPGQVWVNTKSKVYHCQGDRWYGKTKEGEYMTEAQASAKGFRPDHGKACK